MNDWKPTDVNGVGLPAKRMLLAAFLSLWLSPAYAQPSVEVEQVASFSGVRDGWTVPLMTGGELVHLEWDAADPTGRGTWVVDAERNARFYGDSALVEKVACWNRV